MDDQRESILIDLAPLFEEAAAKGLWFYCSYQGLWFSPQQLADKHAEGKFIWGAVNWRLRDPAERLHELLKEKEAAEKAFVLFAKEYSDFMVTRAHAA